MKLAIVGSRHFDNYNLVKETADALCRKYLIDMVISGGASGADTLGEQYATEAQLPKQIYRAEWKKYGRSAGPLRNKLIVKEADIILAFWDGKSKGTGNTIELAKTYKKKVIIVRV